MYKKKNIHNPNTSPRALLKSFTVLCRRETCATDIRIRDPKVYKNKQTVIFTEEEVLNLLNPLQYALDGKMSKNSYLNTIRQAFQKLGLSGNYTVGALHQGFILINLQAEEAYNRLWTTRMVLGRDGHQVETSRISLQTYQQTLCRIHLGLIKKKVTKLLIGPSGGMCANLKLQLE